MKKVLSRTELAKALGCSVSSVDKWRAAGLPVAEVADGRPRFNLARVRGWLSDRGLNSTARFDAARHRQADAADERRVRIDRVEELGRRAELSPGHWIEWLRDALLALPVEEQEEVALPVGVWDALVANRLDSPKGTAV